MTKKHDRYFVGRVGEEWNNRAERFTNLSDALKTKFRYDCTGDYEGGSGKIFVAKEISYKLIADEKTGKVNIVPIGDFESKEPYYLIEEYYYSLDGWEHTTTSNRNLTRLLTKKELPELGVAFHLAHGLELKVNEGKRK